MDWQAINCVIQTCKEKKKGHLILMPGLFGDAVHNIRELFCHLFFCAPNRPVISL